MPLAPGQSLLQFRLVEKIGEGGMGVVWKARDTRLNRDVAIKLLPEAMSSDAERIIRFQNEARTLASLHHPHVASIFGFEESGAHRFLVMELVEGEDLAQRLQRGPLPADEALLIARKLTEGLEAAHEKGIVHRDLKPANVKVTPDGKVKILDFGLAKAFLDNTLQDYPDPSLSPTLTAGPTRAGVIIGTAAYMSPEQARGKPVDKRADIWAFGCVLYEMLTGRRIFPGDTVTDTLASVLKNEPDWSRLPKGTLPRLAALMARCLRKDPRDRLRDIGDARLELAELMTGASDLPATGATPRRPALWMGAAAGVLAGVIATSVALRSFAPQPPAPELRKLSIPISELGGGWTEFARLSPDGRHFVYVRGGRLWIRDLHRFESTEVPGTEAANTPFWSPDSSRIGFAKDRKLWVRTLGEGQATPVCPIPVSGESNGAAWGTDGKIYFAVFRGDIYEVDAAGGDPRLLLRTDPGEVDFHHPQLLPDGDHLVTATHSKEGTHQVIAVSVSDGARRTLGTFEGLGNAVYSPTGHLILNMISGRQRILAVPFSARTLEITGQPFLVVSGGQFPSVSANNSMTYSLGSASVLSELVWVDREGRTGQVLGRPRPGLRHPALSPDGRQVAVVSYENDNADIWIQDLARGTWSKLVAGPQDEYAPVWSKSGDRLFYLRVDRDLFNSVMEFQIGGSGPPRVLAQGVEGPPITVSPDGRTIVFVVEKEGHLALWRRALAGEAQPVRLTSDSSVSQLAPSISPDGRWLAYLSDESGEEEVFVSQFPDGGKKLQVSLHGGSSPFWSQAGDALLYWEGGQLIEVPVKGGASVTFGAPRPLFSAVAAGLEQDLDLAADGRFLFVRRSNEDPHRGVLFVENWIQEFVRN
jgi:serine/threonine protein kinase/Tol biopolymer transport system component